MTAPIPSPHLGPATHRATRRLIAFLGLLYLVSYLDRTNMSFADLTGSERAGLWAVGFAMVAAGLFAIALTAAPQSKVAQQ